MIIGESYFALEWLSIIYKPCICLLVNLCKTYGDFCYVMTNFSCMQTKPLTNKGLFAIIRMQVANTQFSLSVVYWKCNLPHSNLHHIINLLNLIYVSLYPITVTM